MELRESRRLDPDGFLVASLEEIRTEFGDEIAQLVDGVTKLTGMTFESRDERQAENYRKMMVAMATDVRVILIKLADRLHNMRTIGALPKQPERAHARRATGARRRRGNHHRAAFRAIRQCGRADCALEQHPGHCVFHRCQRGGEGSLLVEFPARDGCSPHRTVESRTMPG